MGWDTRAARGNAARSSMQLWALVIALAPAGLTQVPARAIAAPASSAQDDVEPHCDPTPTDPDGDCDSATPDDDDGAGPAKPAAPAPVCVPTVEQVEVCGRTETITEGCEDPIVTPAMHAEAANHDELKDEFHRMSTCVSTDPSCDPHPDRYGDKSLNDEVDAFNQDPEDMPHKIRFHFNVTDISILQARDDMALVVHMGFRRDPLSQHMLFRIHDHKKFNEDAEGVALVQKAMADRERAELIQQATVLEEMRQKFEQRNDKESADNTAQYKNIAVGRALALEAISCELDRLALTDRATEDRMKPLADGPVKTGADGAVTGTAVKNGTSDITGTGQDDNLPAGAAPGKLFPETLNPNGAELPPGGGSPPPAEIPPGPVSQAPPPHDVTGASSPPGFADPALQSFGPDPYRIVDDARARADAVLGKPSEGDSLFLRVHRQYQVRDLIGRFRPSLLD